ncbi:MAG: AI-2E family transporter [Maricaulaceae bacterium]
MDTSIRASLIFLAFVALTWGLYQTRALLAPFALAIFIWLIIDAFARWLDRLSPKLPYWFALTVAVLSVVAGIVGIGVIIADTAQDVAREAPRYQARIAEIFSWMSDKTGQDLSFGGLSDRIGLMEKLQGAIGGFASAVQGVFSDLAIIALYVVFLFAAQSTFPKKMDDLFPDITQRAQATKVGERIRHSIEKYLGVQTIISIIQTILSFIVMYALGLENALFWALVIFILNYIPIVGGLAAVALPVIFSLVQFDPGRIAVLAGLLFGVQSVIGNTIQPKMMGDSMNLSALVVVLSLTLWGALWGGVGAFLSAPLTVIIMIILAQFQTTRWIAVLLSADGQPDLDPEEKKKLAATPSL